jgi:hypothetical protein
LVAWYGFTVKPYGRLRGKVESIAEPRMQPLTRGPEAV